MKTLQIKQSVVSLKEIDDENVLSIDSRRCCNFLSVFFFVENTNITLGKDVMFEQ